MASWPSYLSDMVVCDLPRRQWPAPLVVSIGASSNCPKELHVVKIQLEATGLTRGALGNK